MRFPDPVPRSRIFFVIKQKAGLCEDQPFRLSVGAARFELAASTSQMWRDNRATLRPESKGLQMYEYGWKWRK